MRTILFNKLHNHILPLFCMLLVLCIGSFGFYHITNTQSAKASTHTDKELSFESVPVTSDDTLWSIAKEHYTEEYGSINNYIKEIKRCNALVSDDINAGSALIVPVYIPANQF